MPHFGLWRMDDKDVLKYQWGFKSVGRAVVGNKGLIFFS